MNLHLYFFFSFVSFSHFIRPFCWSSSLLYFYNIFIYLNACAKFCIHLTGNNFCYIIHWIFIWKYFYQQQLKWITHSKGKYLYNQDIDFQCYIKQKFRKEITSILRCDQLNFLRFINLLRFKIETYFSIIRFILLFFIVNIALIAFENDFPSYWFRFLAYRSRKRWIHSFPKWIRE